MATALQTKSSPIEEIKLAARPVRQQLVEHPLYQSMTSIEHLRWFMENHVFAVWDFMVLLKALQRQLTSVDTIWHPVGEPVCRRLINEIVLSEESDFGPDGEVASHFEMYLSAMEEVGADTRAVNQFLQAVTSGTCLQAAFDPAGVPEPAQRFVEHTLSVVDGGSLPAIASAFTFGREELIPSMFRTVLAEIESNHPGGTRQFLYYLQRHIELDGDSHSELACQVVCQVCKSAGDWELATHAALQSLDARRQLWDGVQRTMKQQRDKSKQN